MSSRICRLLVLAALLSAGTCSGVRAEEILVSAAASLRDVLQELAGRYEASTGDRVVLNFASSGTLALQIRRGAPVDLFFSANAGLMDRLEAEGLVHHENRVDLLSNALVVVGSADGTAVSPGFPADPRELLRFRRIAIGQPDSVPAGDYARQWLRSVGLWEALGDRLVPTVDVRAALAAVEAGHADAAIVYATDAAISSRVRIVFRVPPDEGPRIVYPLAVTAGSSRRQPALRLAAWLASPETRPAYEKHGFGLLAAREGD